MSDLRIGCAGWHYSDWVGPVYPPRLDSGQWLPTYAQHFPIVEVDSTFYALPAEAAVRGWIERTQSAPRFGFAAKLWREATHEHLGRDVAKTHEAARQFLQRVVHPLEAARRFEAVLVQLPPTFDAFGKAGREAPIDELGRLLDVLEPRKRRVAVEFRHASWFDHVGERLAPEAAEALTARGVAAARVDGLGSRFIVDRTSDWSYVRLHGRRSHVPEHEKGHSHAPYDYLYSIEEVGEIARFVRSVSIVDASTLVIFNNHYRGQAAKNAVDLMEMLGVEHKPLKVNVSKDRSLDDY